eukprot:TRINITY_DN2991_c1_g1_i2.p1 TRINITY_DN2991_c1_g1~~TRINITY_DN2991_c1_g1_i2.p1  ORF type:complete len:756 (+),score=271.88 TRINITY_DN2991_c1_g1_i2:58-2268(+)
MQRRAAICLLLAHLVQGNMMDVIEKYRVASKNCPLGCDDWTNHNASLWHAGKVPSDAGSYCAQPGAAVNTALYGGWCYCKQHTEEEKGKREVGSPPPPSWDDIGNARCETTVKQFGETPPAGFQYDTQSGMTGSLYYSKQVSLDTCQGLCVNNLTNCDYVSWGHGGWCYLAEWCTNMVPKVLDYETYHNGAQPVPPAPTPPPKDWDYCVPVEGVPEQVNIQIASGNAVVISWVTFESVAPSAAPTATVNGTAHTGVTHTHTTQAQDRVYYMHFVLVEKLTAGVYYSYTVKSGGSGAATSEAFLFRAPKSWAADAPTTMDIYGDMGVYTYNNMEWLHKDCVTDGTVDLVVHMGDHAYNEGEDDERRADGYMNGFQPTLSSCPWLPNVGNHEYYSGAELNRYLDSTWQKWGPLPATDQTAAAAKETQNTTTTTTTNNKVNKENNRRYNGSSSATSALGYLLSAGNHHGVGVHGALPSNTSRYFSVNYGKVHLVALDLNGYYGTDPCGAPCQEAQLAWLKQDLAEANKNRDQFPWVVVFSHFPLFCTGCQTKQFASYYESNEAEKSGNGNKTAATAWGKSPAHLAMLKKMGFKTPDLTVKAGSDVTIDTFEPIFLQYGVDLYVAGHWHYYESLYPATSGKASCKTCAEPTQDNFDSPKVTVHVTSGNGGPPGKDSFTEDCPGPDCGHIPATRKQTTEFSYGRITAHNTTHLTFQQFFNSNGSLFDSWTIYQPNHGPFTN